MQDPRIFFAAERTLLAWLRTGLTVIVVGFVVARFGLFARLVAHSATGASAGTGFSAALGVLFVLAGSISILLATRQHLRFIATLPAQDLPASYSRSFAVVVSGAVGALGVLLAAYLVVSAS